MILVAATDPMMLDFGIESAYGQGFYLFYDGGDDRIERYSLGGPAVLIWLKCAVSTTISRER